MNKVILRYLDAKIKLIFFLNMYIYKKNIDKPVEVLIYIEKEI
jgi:hypothetical protein